MPTSAPIGKRETAPRPRPTDVLFLVADTGGGHRAAARAVARHLAATEADRWSVHVLDPFVDASPTSVGRIVGLYSPIIRHIPWLWGALYHSTNSRAAVSLLGASALRLVEPAIAEVTAALRPAAVVSFHPLLNHPAARVLRRMPGPRIPLVTVVTDLVDVHRAWSCEHAEAVVTGTASALATCRRAGVASDRSFDLGLPVDDRFSAEAAGDRRALRRALGLDPGSFLVVMSGGGEGSGGLERRATAVLEAGLPVQVNVVCGRNGRLRERLEARAHAFSGRLAVSGFVSDMPDRLRAADLLVTKAGPGTIAEALCARVPLLLSSYVPGQERGNVDLVVGSGAGRYVPGVRSLVAAVSALSRPGSPELDAMRAAVARVARPRATAAVARLIATHALAEPATR